MLTEVQSEITIARGDILIANTGSTRTLWYLQKMLATDKGVRQIFRLFQTP